MTSVSRDEGEEHEERGVGRFGRGCGGEAREGEEREEIIGQRLMNFASSAAAVLSQPRGRAHVEEGERPRP